jgi:hypothetical protein
VNLHLQITSDGISLMKHSSGWQNFDGNQKAFLPWSQLNGFDQFLNEHQIEKKYISQINAEICHHLFLLIPTEYNSNSFKMGYLEKALGSKEIIGKEVHEQICQKEDADFVFLVDSEWKDFLANHFPLAKINYEHILANLIISHNRFLRTQLNLFLTHQKLAFVVCRKNGKLHIANLFVYQSHKELAFYIHSIRDAFDLTWSNDLLQIAGIDSQNTSLIESLVALKIPISFP